MESCPDTGSMPVTPYDKKHTRKTDVTRQQMLPEVDLYGMAHNSQPIPRVCNRAQIIL